MYAQFQEKKEVLVEFNQVLDNREYFNDFINPQTILGASTNVLFGAEVAQGHSLYGGFYYLYEYGHFIDGHKPQLNLFYQFNSDKYEFYFGAFPRKDLLNYPLALMTDTLMYYRPNVQGGLGKIKWSFGEQNIWCDWTSRQSDTIKETFLAGFCGEIRANIFYIENYAYMYHSAGTAIRDWNDPIRDNGGGALFLGADLSEFGKFNSLRVDIGVLTAYDRFRPNPYGFAFGGMLRTELMFEKLGFKASYYKGNKINLVYGDNFYTSGNYGRLDLIWYPFKSKRVNAKIDLGLHFTEDGVDSSQQFYITVNFAPYRKVGERK